MRDDRDDSGSTYESPVNPLPPVVMLLALAVIGVEAALSLGAAGVVGGQRAIGWRNELVAGYAFVPGVLDYVLAGRFDWEIIRRFVSYLFVHASFTDALFGTVLLLALGKYVGEVLSAGALLAVFLVSGVAGAVTFGAILSENYPLIGVWPAVYGLIGGFTFLTWQKLGQIGGRQIAAFRLIAFLMGLQLVFGLLFGSNYSWIAEIGGFVAGLVLTPLLAPGGTDAVRRRLRQR